MHTQGKVLIPSAESLLTPQIKLILELPPVNTSTQRFVLTQIWNKAVGDVDIHLGLVFKEMNKNRRNMSSTYNNLYIT